MRFIGFIGLFAIMLIAYLLSKNRRAINLRTVAWGFGLQWVLALLVLGVPALGIGGPLHGLFHWADKFFIALMNFTSEGSRFLFGSLMTQDKNGFIFAVQVLPTIIFFSALVALGYHLGILQKITLFMGKIMARTMGTSGAESLSASANIFLGQTEAPLLVKPFIARMTNSEIMAVMTAGMASTAGGVLAAYVGLLKDSVPNIAGHLLTASVMSAPAALLISKILIPETQRAETAGKIPETTVEKDANVIDAISRGVSEGVGLAINVGAMLVVFIAFVALGNAVLGHAGEWIGFSNWGQHFVPEVMAQAHGNVLSLQLIFGWIFSPLAFLMGIPWNEAVAAGAFLGEKVALNEFVAYLHLSQMSSELSERTLTILSYALCGFANFSSIGIQIGGIGIMAPERRGDLAKLGIYSVIGGSLSTFMAAAIAGILL